MPALSPAQVWDGEVEEVGNELDSQRKMADVVPIEP